MNFTQVAEVSFSNGNQLQCDYQPCQKDQLHLTGWVDPRYFQSICPCFSCGLLLSTRIRNWIWGRVI